MSTIPDLSSVNYTDILVLKITIGLDSEVGRGAHIGYTGPSIKGEC